MNAKDVDIHLAKHFLILFKLAEMGALRRTVKVSTEYLAERMGSSQQTSSRYLIELEKMSWIKRTITPEGSLIKISNLGTNELKKVYKSMSLIMEASYPPSITLEGVLFTGLGEGAYYVMKEGYRKQFIERLGFNPYPGTLNLKLTADYDIKSLSELDAYPAIKIQGFKNESRTYGPVKCYPTVLNNKVKGALVSALRSHYNSSVLEIIAPIFIRNRLKLKDGNKVKVEILTLP